MYVHCEQVDRVLMFHRPDRCFHRWHYGPQWGQDLKTMLTPVTWFCGFFGSQSSWTPERPVDPYFGGLCSAWAGSCATSGSRHWGPCVPLGRSRSGWLPGRSCDDGDGEAPAWWVFPLTRSKSYIANWHAENEILLSKVYLEEIKDGALTNKILVCVAFSMSDF